MARLDRVALSKEIAQVGSVIGREFSYELIAGLELMSEETLSNGLQHLISSGLATCQGEINFAAEGASVFTSWIQRVSVAACL